MADIRWVENHLEIEPPKRFKKLTATKFATVLGLNPWSTPFQIWCDVTKTWVKPFEDTIYTAAGKAIEPLQIQYMKEDYFMSDLKTPTDVFGEDYFSRTYGDFYPDVKVLGGMWDSLLVDSNGKPRTVLEFKTSKRSEDWSEDIPEYYALQAALYAYLLGVDDVIMVASFLSPKDYEHPADFKPSVKNTITRSFKVSERYPDFADKVKQALTWWDTYVQTGISPDYDPVKDAEPLEALRTTTLSPDTDMNALLEQAATLTKEIDEVTKTVSVKEKRLKKIKELVKQYLTENMDDTSDKATLSGSGYVWTLAKSTSVGLDEDRLKEDGLWEKYCTASKTSVRLTVSAAKE